MRYLILLLILTSCCEQPDWVKTEIRERAKKEAFKQCGAFSDGIYELDGKFGCVYLAEDRDLDDLYYYDGFTTKSKIQHLWDSYLIRSGK